MSLSPSPDPLSGWAGLRRRLREVPPQGWHLGVMAVVAAVFRVSWLFVIIVGVTGSALVAQRGMRRRGRRLHAEAAASGGGVWLGRVPIEQAESLWGSTVPWFLSFLYARDGYPVRLTAQSSGLALHPRGGLLNRLRRLKPALIPWSDLAGARARHLGFSTESQSTLWLVPLTLVTIDLVGASAEGHLPPPSPEEMDKELRRLGIDPDQPDDDDPDEFDADEQAEDLAFWREVHGEDWRPGTEPLHFTTSHPDSLVEIVTMRGRGHPESALAL